MGGPGGAALSVSFPEAIAVFGAGVAAGGINAIVGSGSLITFPTLLAFGVPAVTANVSNNVGLVPGNVSGAYGYRKELAGQWKRLLRLASASAIGAAAGAILLLELPAATFKVIVAALILIACALVVLQPRLNGWLAKRREGGSPNGGPVLWAGVCGSGIYGGYFGAAQGVLMIGLLGIFLDEPLQRINGLKNVLTFVVNGVAAIVFISVTHIDWILAGLIAVGSTIGGYLGARYGRRLPPMALRILIVIIGVIAAVKLIFFS
ncbi:MAG TPA: sulfite exporter TauE/SafE family protein [Streptosporangiaceae bacterium]|nr:sulfite exporter TauE/SafE family protein [Streptosporangiaceae bacterium]